MFFSEKAEAAVISIQIKIRKIVLKKHYSLKT